MKNTKISFLITICVLSSFFIIDFYPKLNTVSKVWIFNIDNSKLNITKFNCNHLYCKEKILYCSTEYNMPKCKINEIFDWKSLLIYFISVIVISLIGGIAYEYSKRKFSR